MNRDNRIRRIHITNGRLDPVEAEAWVDVYPEHLTTATEVRGRLMGPRCPYSSTVEVAYPLQEAPLGKERGQEACRRLRGIIPEPCLWDPETPFLYEGPVELWQAGQLCDQVQIIHGLRRFNLGPQGLRWNGRPLTLRGAICSSCQPDDALRLRRAGGNLLFAPVGAGNSVLWENADRLGFLVLGRVADRNGLAESLTLGGHISCLGWVLTSPLVQDECLTAPLPLDLAADRRLIGIELLHKPTEPLPDWVQFVVCPEDLLSALIEIALPKILLKPAEIPQGQGLNETARLGLVLGWIQESG
jgi:hypothetical protein